MAPITCTLGIPAVYGPRSALLHTDRPYSVLTIPSRHILVQIARWEKLFTSEPVPKTSATSQSLFLAIYAVFNHQYLASKRKNKRTLVISLRLDDGFWRLETTFSTPGLITVRVCGRASSPSHPSINDKYIQYGATTSESTSEHPLF